jgi:hypothetical protein
MEADMLKNPAKRQDFIMIHMSAIITLSVFCKKADASLADFKVSLVGLFHPESFRDLLAKRIFATFRYSQVE